MPRQPDETDDQLRERVLREKVWAALDVAMDENGYDMTKETAEHAAVDLCDYDDDFESMYDEVLPHVRSWQQDRISKMGGTID